MKRIVFFVVSVLAAVLAAAPSASATASARTVVCIPESLRLLGTNGDSICLAAPTPSIMPPFTAFAEQNGSQFRWCLYTAANYGGGRLTIPPFSQEFVFATFGSGRPC